MVKILYMILSRKKNYLQIALNSTREEAYDIVRKLPISERIIIEAGTPLIKRFGIGIVSDIKLWWATRLGESGFAPYVVADLKTMDRGETEVMMAYEAGASGVVVLGQAPIETINSVIVTAAKMKIDSMVDMMNIEQPVKILRQLKKLSDVVILHRGVDEETFNKSKPIPYIQINKVRSSYDVMLGLAGGDTPREVQRAIFNDAEIVVVWKEFYTSTDQTAYLAEAFLREIK